MNARSGEPRRRWLGIAAAAAVVAIPIALIATTWEPLEPPPRAERPAWVEEAATPERTREARPIRRSRGPADDRPERRDRDRERRATPAAATPPS